LLIQEEAEADCFNEQIKRPGAGLPVFLLLWIIFNPLPSAKEGLILTGSVQSFIFNHPLSAYSGQFTLSVFFRKLKILGKVLRKELVSFLNHFHEYLRRNVYLAVCKHLFLPSLLFFTKLHFSSDVPSV
jgi:hypothetical protein